MTKPQDPIEPITATMPPVAPAHGRSCENCSSTLQGSYCHVCGQHAHNPLRSFRHAVEDVFESFWHLDGRIFRSLRDLLIPGRVTGNYLAGQRVRYIPPLRLYVILSLMTFFIAHFVTAGIKGGGIDIRGSDGSFGELKTAAAVMQERDRQLASLDKAIAEVRNENKDIGHTIASSALDRGRARIVEQAEDRIAELEGRKPSTAHTPGPRVKASVFGGRKIGKEGGFMQRLQGEWEKNAEANAALYAKDKRALIERFISYVPTVLLVLLPLFALVLRIGYPMRPMGYLEHLVVALYSHSFLLLAIMAWMLVVLIERATGGSVMSSMMAVLFWFGMPIYMLMSQKRIYGDGWPLTLLRFSLIAVAYFFLVTLGLAAATALSLLLKG